MAAEELLMQPTDFPLGELNYPLARADHELELYFQSRHEAWARNRIEATRAMVGDAAYRADCETFAERRDANRFAFGAHLSLQWLTSDEGMIEYVLLLSAKGKKERGGAAFTKPQLRQMKKAAPEDWERLTREVLTRDFPFLMIPPPTTGGPTPETPPSTTSGSSSSSQGSPTLRAGQRSSGCPAGTS